MAILNVTPDSFSENGLNFNQSLAVDAAKRMVDEGADILDIGGESTRPGADPVESEVEIARVVPVIKASVSLGVPISIDTRKGIVAQAALEAGATIVNDVTALSDPQMLPVCVDSGCHVCLMHIQYGDVVVEVFDYLEQRAMEVEAQGISRSKIWLDPGIGFGKSALHNLLLLHALPNLVSVGYPVLIGVSRKSFIGVLSGANVGQRLPGTLAAQVLAQHAGVKIIRAHDVKEARQAIDVAAAILTPSSFSRLPA